MAKLTGQTIADSYDQLLIVDNASGISASLQAIEAGDTGGSASSLKISTSKCEVIPASNSTSLFEVSQSDGTPVLSVDTTNARVGIGTATPNTLLHLFGASPTLQLSDDSADGGGGAFNIDFCNQNTVQARIHSNLGNESISFYTNASMSTAQMCIDSQYGGSVGIGTTSPKQTLDVAGDVRIMDGRSLFFKRIDDSANTEFAWRIRNESIGGETTDPYSTGWDGSNKLVFEVVQNSQVQANPGDSSHTIYGNTANLLVLHESGSVGIGTSTPPAYGNTSLQIYGSDNCSFQLKAANSTSGEKVFAMYNNTQKVFFKGLNDAGTGDGTAPSIMTLQLADGNVGIGTDSPAGLLDIRDGSLVLSEGDVSGAGTTDNIYARMDTLHATNGGLEIMAWSDTDAGALFLGAEMGATDPTDTTPCVEINASKWDGSGTGGQALAAAETVLKIRNYTTDLMTILGSGDVAVPFWQANTTGSGANAFIDSDGTLRRSTSSLRYKKDVNYDSISGSALYDLKPCSFKGNGSATNSNEETTEYIGFIAEDVDKVEKRLVIYDEEGKPDALHYANFTALIVKTIQELSAKVTALENA